MLKYRNTDYQIGMLGGKDLSSIKRVYGEFAPYHKVSSVDELVKQITVR